MDSIDIQQIHNNNFTNTQYGKFKRISICPWQPRPARNGHSRPGMDQTSAQFTFKRFIFILVGGNPIDIDVQLYGQSNPYGQTDSSADISNLSQSLSQGLTIGGQWSVDKWRPIMLQYQNFLQKSLFPLCK